MRKLIPCLMTTIVVAAMAWQVRTPDTMLMPAPSVVFPEIVGATFEEVGMSDAERETLPKDTVIFRRLYRFDDGSWFQVSAVVGGRSKSSVHRPELCLPGQGFQMSDPHTIDVGGTSWRKLTLINESDGRAGFAYTFVNGSGFRTSSHFVRIFTDVWDRSILGRIDRWVMLTVSASRADDATMERFLGFLKGIVK